jgi:hypothetical protein
MQYLLIDTHKRLLGMVTSNENLQVGDKVRSSNTQTFTVIGIDWSAQRGTDTHALTVIPAPEIESARAGKAAELIMQA